MQIGLDNKTSPDTRLTFCTTAVLREKLVRERNMLAYTHVIIDEVHERDLETDFIMLIVRKLLRTNSRTVKVIHIIHFFFLFNKLFVSCQLCLVGTLFAGHFNVSYHRSLSFCGLFLLAHRRQTSSCPCPGYRETN